MTDQMGTGQGRKVTDNNLIKGEYEMQNSALALEMDKKQICDLWNEEIRNDPEYNDSFHGLEVTLEEGAPIRWAPFSKDMQETADRLGGIQAAIVHRAYDRSRVRYYKTKYPETYDK